MVKSWRAVLPRDAKIKEAVVTVRLTTAEVEKLDAVTKGQLSRSQVVRLLIQDYLEKSEGEQQEFLVGRLFGR